MTAFFVDLDGTIIDPKAGMIGSFRRALCAVGENDLARGDLDWIIGPPIRSSFTSLLQDEEQAANALRRYREYYSVDGALFEFEVYPGIIDALLDLCRLGQVLICTMKPEPLAEPILERLDLNFALFAADLEGEIRSKDQILNRAVSQLGLDARDCMVIGDRGSDMAAARRTGMVGLGVTWGYGDLVELQRAGATGHCDQPIDLPRAVAGLLT